MIQLCKLVAVGQCFAILHVYTTVYYVLLCDGYGVCIDCMSV